MGHEVISRPFSDVHRKGDHVVATLLHDPTVEGLDVALYMDGSASMEPEYGPRGVLAKLGGVRNNVEPQMRWMLEYLAGKDRNGVLRVAYWATGSGSDIEIVGDLTGDQAKEFKFPGPRQYGKGTVMLPVLRDYVAYLREQVPQGARRGLAVIITDSQLHDPDDVRAYSTQVAKEIVAGRLPRLNFVLVGVGAQVDEEQMEEVAHAEYPGVGHLWCHRHADRMEEMADLVAVLVDDTMTVADGGVIRDARGPVLRQYEGRLPAVLEFDVPSDCTRFVLEVGGQSYPQDVPSDHGDHDDDDDHEDDHTGEGDAVPPPPPDADADPVIRPRHRGHRH
ncbi:MAG: VWA domain-containing protein [Myxococcota bacterium]